MIIFNGARIFSDDIDQEALEIVRWLELDPETIYLGSSIVSPIIKPVGGKFSQYRKLINGKIF